MSHMKLIVAIVNFFKKESEKSELSDDTKESLEVAIQCLQTAYDLKAEDLCSPEYFTNRSLLEIFNEANKCESPAVPHEVSEEVQKQAEMFKTQGNSLMKMENHSEAVEAYTKAIILDGSNAVYYCNRAAAFSRMSDYYAAIKDCEQAINLDKKYSKAYGRMGLAYVSLGNTHKAMECYRMALELDPTNESYRINLKLAEEKSNNGEQSFDAANAGGSVDVNELFNNPVLRNMATTMMQDPNMFNVLSGLVNASTTDGVGAPRAMDALLQAGQQFAAQMQASNPQLIEQLRQQVTGNHRSQDSENKDQPPN